jgi:nucleoside-diphosphate-sugar epimerase
VRVLITGASGFIGKYLNKELEKNRNYRISHLKSDLRHYNDVASELKYTNPDVIIHLAAKTEVEKSFYDPMGFSEVNYLGTVNLAESALQVPNLKQFIFASTMETYGWQPISDDIKNGNIPDVLPVFNEDTPQNPNAAYAVAKVGCEQYIKYLHRAYGLPYVILRQTNTYGRWDNDFFVVEQFIRQMLSQTDEVYFGYPKPYRNFLFIDDLIQAYLTLVERSEEINAETFTVGPPNAIQISHLANVIAAKVGWNGKINWYTRPKRPGEIYLLNSGYDKIYNMIGWYPKVLLDEGLDKTIKLWRNT